MSDLSNSALARIVRINSYLGAIGLLSSMLSSIIIFRILPTERYTELALCQAIISYFNLILDLGGGSAFSRYFVEAKAIRATANLFALIRNRRVLYSTILIALACICGPMYGSNTNFPSLKNDILPWATLGLISGLQLLGGLAIAGLQALYKQALVLSLRILFVVAKSGGTVLGFLILDDVVGILFVLAVIHFVEMAAYQILLQKFIGQDRMNLPSEMARDSTRFGLITIIDKVLVGLTFPNMLLVYLAVSPDPRNLAYLALATDFTARVISMVNLPFSGVVQPFLNNSENASTLTERGVRHMQFAGLIYGLVMVALVPLAPSVVWALFGVTDSQEWFICQIILASSALDCFSRSATVYLLRRGLYRLNFVGDMLLIVVLAVTVFFFSKISVMSAVISYAIVRGAVSLCWAATIRGTYLPHRINAPIVFVFAAGLAGYFSSFIRIAVTDKLFWLPDFLLPCLGIACALYSCRYWTGDVRPTRGLGPAIQ